MKICEGLEQTTAAIISCKLAKEYNWPYWEGTFLQRHLVCDLLWCMGQKELDSQMEHHAPQKSWHLSTWNKGQENPRLYSDYVFLLNACERKP